MGPLQIRCAGDACRASNWPHAPIPAITHQLRPSPPRAWCNVHVPRCHGGGMACHRLRPDVLSHSLRGATDRPHWRQGPGIRWTRPAQYSVLGDPRLRTFRRHLWRLPPPALWELHPCRNATPRAYASGVCCQTLGTLRASSVARWSPRVAGSDQGGLHLAQGLRLALPLLGVHDPYQERAQLHLTHMDRSRRPGSLQCHFSGLGRLAAQLPPNHSASSDVVGTDP
jgi:hypothetical protein